MSRPSHGDIRTSFRIRTDVRAHRRGPGHCHLLHGGDLLAGPRAGGRGLSLRTARATASRGNAARDPASRARVPARTIASHPPRDRGDDGAPPVQRGQGGSHRALPPPSTHRRAEVPRRAGARSRGHAAATAAQPHVHPRHLGVDLRRRLDQLDADEGAGPRDRALRGDLPVAPAVRRRRLPRLVGGLGQRAGDGRGRGHAGARPRRCGARTRPGACEDPAAGGCRR